MAVIIEGPQLKRVNCNACKSVIGYLPEEVQSYTKTDWSGSIDVYYQVKCPRSQCPGYGYPRHSY